MFDQIMRRPREDAKREERIEMEVVVDAYGPEERAMGWYCYLENELHFPFRAKCIAQRAISPLGKGQEVEVEEVEEVAPGEECGHEMFVGVAWEGRTLTVPLSQLAIIKADKATTQAVEDWHYWVARGYEF